jgi:hypothetical protein
MLIPSGRKVGRAPQNAKYSSGHPPLIKEGRKIVLISLGATEKAFEMYKLKTKVEKLAKDHKNFFYSPVLQ